MLGGMSWESTAVYYRAINEGVKAELGSLHSAEIILKSLDFDKIEQLQHAGDWEATAGILKKAAKSVEVAGADFLIICTNTMHIVAPEISNHIKIPILHIADATGERLIKDKISSVGLLGTNLPMEKPFYKDRLRKKYGEKGFLDARIRSTRTPNLKTKQIDLRFDISENSEFVVNSVLVRGNEKTKTMQPMTQ